MTFSKPFVWISALCVALSFTSCCRQESSCDMWDDTRTAGRYFGKGFSALAGNNSCSRQVSSREDFCCMYDNGDDPYAQFIPLEDQSARGPMGMKPVQMAQPKELPGDPGSRLPGIEAFIDPSTDPELARVFQNIQFAYDSSAVKDASTIAQVRGVANYMKSHPDLYLFVEGHCDERGPEAYNLALGARRANTVRAMLLTEGVNKDHVFTISYGKERPLVMEHHDEARAKNRRVEFKVYRP